MTHLIFVDCPLAIDCTFDERLEGIQDCKTATCYPQSNGMAESFVKTLKRDYLAFVKLKDGDMALAEFPKIIELYNQEHPHSALGYLSPYEFRVSEGLVQMRESAACFGADK